MRCLITRLARVWFINISVITVSVTSRQALVVSTYVNGVPSSGAFSVHGFTYCICIYNNIYIASMFYDHELSLIYEVYILILSI